MQQVFIGGCGRSGTTFLAATIGKHTKAIVTPESQFKFRLLLDGSLTGQKAIDYLRDNWRFRTWNFDADALQDRIVSASSQVEILNYIVQQYASENGIRSCELWVDHTPNNMEYYPDLQSCYPEAKYIHIVRDCRAVAASVLPLPWGPNTVIDAARWWTNKIAIGLGAESFFAPETIMRVRYEDLVSDLDRTLTQILEFLQINKMPEHKGSLSLPQFTQSQHALVDGAPNKSRIQSWRTALTNREVEIIESQTAVLLRYLGYKLSRPISEIRPVTKNGIL